MISCHHYRGLSPGPGWRVASCHTTRASSRTCGEVGRSGPWGRKTEWQVPFAGEGLHFQGVITLRHWSSHLTEPSGPICAGAARGVNSPVCAPAGVGHGPDGCGSHAERSRRGKAGVAGLAARRTAGRSAWLRRISAGQACRAGATSASHPRRPTRQSALGTA